MNSRLKVSLSIIFSISIRHFQIKSIHLTFITHLTLRFFSVASAVTHSKKTHYVLMSHVKWIISGSFISSMIGKTYPENGSSTC